MRFVVFAASCLFSLSLNSFPLAWANSGALSRAGASAKAAVSDGIAKVSEKLGQVRRSSMRELAEAQWKPEHKKRFLRTKVNMVQQEKPEFVMFFAHGYRPKTLGFGYPKEKVQTMVAPFLRAFKYVVYHPLLSVGPAYTTFAQKDDIDQVKFHLDRVIGLITDPKSPYYNLPLICAGHSNGASTLITLFGTYPDLAKSVALALLFAPYADVKKTRFFQGISENSAVAPVANHGPKISGLLYDSKGKTPMDFVEAELFSKDLPVFLVHSLDDKHIPMSANFTAFAQAFKDHGYANAKTFAFERGGHGDFLANSGKDERAEFRKSLRNFINRDILKRAILSTDEESSMGSVVEQLLVETEVREEKGGGALV